MEDIAEAVNVEFENDFDLNEVKKILSDSPGVIVEDDAANFKYPMPINAHDRDEVFVGRLRRDESNPKYVELCGLFLIIFAKVLLQMQFRLQNICWRKNYCDYFIFANNGFANPE